MKKYELRENDFYKIAEEFFSLILDGNIKVTKSMKLINNDNGIDLRFYLVREDGFGQTEECELTYEDISNVINYSLKDTPEELDFFQYIGFVRRVGYFVDENTPIFEGFMVHTKDKDLALKMKKDLNK